MTPFRIPAALLLAIILIGPGRVAAQNDQAASSPKNVILFVTDGFGPAMSTMARDYRRDFLGEGDELVMDGIEVGSVRTYATNSRVTDSAAGATAYATGIKSYNGAIGVDSSGSPVGTLVEAAKAAGMRTGIVTTTRVTHATPAAFTAHVPRRAQEDDIAVQQLEVAPDLILGGGRRFFYPEADGGARKDGRDLLREAEATGFNVASTWGEARASRLPLLALLDDDSLPYEVDRPEAEPSLAELTTLALAFLDDADGGFFVMIEAARIDHAAHGNDAAGTLHDVLAFDEALGVALEFAHRDGSTLIVSVADHETGGLSLGRAGVYSWEPEVLSRVRASHGPIIDAVVSSEGGYENVMRELAGIDELSDDERASLETAGINRRLLGTAIGEIIAKRAGIGWTTGGHTGVDVKLYASGPGRDRFIGNHDNTYVGRTIADLLDLDLGAVTRRLQSEASAEVLQE